MRTSKVFFIAAVILMVFIVYRPSISEEKRPSDYYYDPQAVIDQISSRGAFVIVFELYYEPNIWSVVLRNIAIGDELWLKVAIALHPGSDAGSSEMLGLAVGEALEHAPETVLHLALKEFDLITICSGPDVDDFRYDSYELSIKTINLRIKSVAAVKDPTLNDICNKCIRYLEDSKIDLEKYYGVSTE